MEDTMRWWEHRIALVTPLVIAMQQNGWSKVILAGILISYMVVAYKELKHEIAMATLREFEARLLERQKTIRPGSDRAAFGERHLGPAQSDHREEH